ncbi:DUF2797 domain-containing protein [Nocardiopsis quinghaiensis]|uniref:DUF2797 domain-containing protein n=1 Tax=Nocardiopsis quinghaiensis TaxID=464995 RepID=UPI00123BC624|nr:DUF2797 domain-containing protein [Nocardiopsis quinghaiensis]
MTITAPVTVLGLDWSTPDTPCLRTTATPDGSQLHPLLGEHTFRVDGDERYCVGWFDLTGPEGRHVRCRNDETVTRGRQCRRCQYKEGFVAAHQAHHNPHALPDNIRGYLQQPHWLYLDVFAKGMTKVGTAAELRRRSRLAEQGPVAAVYIARTSDGIAVRALEAAVSRHLGLPQQVPTRHKVLGLQDRVDTAALMMRLTELAAEATAYLATITADQPGTEVFLDPEPWARPACATTVFDAAPVLAYPAALTEGTHHLRVTGASGPVALFTTEPGPDAARYCADLSKLIGRRLVPATPENAPTSAPTLF